MSLGTHFLLLAQGQLNSGFSQPCWKADIAINPLMTDRLCVNFHWQNDLSAVLLFRPWPWVIIFHVIFWFDRRSLVKWNGKSNDVSMHMQSGGAGGETVDVAAGSSATLHPGASQQLLEAMWLFPTILPHRFLLVPGTCCYLGLLLSPAWLLSTLRECSVRFSLHHFLCLIPNSAIALSFSVKFWSVALNSQLCFFFFNSSSLYLDVCFKDTVNSFLYWLLHLHLVYKSLTVSEMCVQLFIYNKQTWKLKKADSDNLKLLLKQNLEVFLRWVESIISCQTM